MKSIIHIDAGYITFEEYARRTGLTLTAVKRQAEKGLIPIYHQKIEGKERGKLYVNNALLITQALGGAA